MRTETLLLTAVLGVAATATTMAQVYSVNAVGYVNVDLKPGFQIIANPLDAGAGNNTAEKLLVGVPDGTTVYKYTGSGFDINDYTFGAWATPGMVLEPGTGFFVQLPPGANAKVTFVGDVTLGTASNMSVPAGLALVGSKVPQAGKLGTDLKFPAGEGDFIYQWDQATQGYKTSTFSFGAWDPADPTIAVAEGFWTQKQAAAAWDRNFSISGP